MRFVFNKSTALSDGMLVINNHHAQTERKRKFDCFLFKITVTWNGIVFAFAFFFCCTTSEAIRLSFFCFFGVFLFFFLLLLLVGAACSAPGCGWKQKQKRPSSIHRLVVRGVASPARYQLSWRPRQFLNLASTGLIVVVVVIIFLLDEWCEWYVFDKTPIHTASIAGRSVPRVLLSDTRSRYRRQLSFFSCCVLRNQYSDDDERRKRKEWSRSEISENDHRWLPRLVPTIIEVAVGPHPIHLDQDLSSSP